MKEDTILPFIFITLSLFSLGIILTLVERIAEFLIKVHHLQALILFSLFPDVKWGEALKYFGVKNGIFIYNGKYSCFSGSLKDG